MSDVMDALVAGLPGVMVSTGEAAGDDFSHDECLTVSPTTPAAVVRPKSTAEVAQVLRVADQLRIPVTARGSGTGLSGAAIPRADGIVVSFERMDDIVEIDVENHVAVVQPGVTLDQLDEATAAARPRVPRVSRASTARASAATSPPTPAACAP